MPSRIPISGNPRRLVVKIGTALLTDQHTGVNSGRIEEYARSLARLARTGTHIAIVSSGAIGAGVAELGLSERPRTIPEKQATAAVGQPILMGAYERAFNAEHRTVAQVLLTKDDFAVRSRYLNAKRTFSSLFSHGVIPIINENDTVAVDEIKLGDNDNLSALVAQLIGADLLVVLSDIDGLYSDDPALNPNAELIPVVEQVTAQLERQAKRSRTPLGTGGMTTKLQAAKTCSAAGIAMIIANGTHTGILDDLASGSFRGTLFLPTRTPLSVRKNWIGFIARTRGTIVIDEGAATAILHRHSSLLPSGILEVKGKFHRGDTIAVRDQAGREIARGITTLSSDDLAKVKGTKTGAMRSILGKSTPEETIHKDNLAILIDNP